MTVQVAVSCSGCGLNVAPGYPCCPKCQTPLPRRVVPFERSRRATTLSGGTSIAPPSRATLYTAIVGATLCGIILFALIGPKSTAESSAQQPAAGLERDLAGSEPPAPQVVATANPVATQPSPASKQDDARLMLEQALTNRRLWAQVTAGLQDNWLVVTSALCDEPETKQAIIEHAQTLALAGFVRLECRARHGGLIFDQAL